jgi:hypothetical protein
MKTDFDFVQEQERHDIPPHCGCLGCLSALAIFSAALILIAIIHLIVKS